MTRFRLYCATERVVLGASLASVSMTCSSASTEPAGGHIIDIAAGALHTCALTGAGEVLCWGDNRYGQLGVTVRDSGRAVDIRMLPTPVPIAEIFRSVAAGGDNTCGLVTDGRVICWGLARFIVSRDSASGLIAPPTPILSPIRFNSVSLGWAHACAATQDGDVYCWGANDRGAAGDPQADRIDQPTRIVGLPAVDMVDAGYSHSCAVADGEVWCWGTIVPREEPTWPPSRAKLTGTALAVSAGGYHTCAVVDRSVWCWGRNEAGEIGVASTTVAAEPVGPLNDETFASVSTGRAFTCALSTVGQPWCWGLNIFGQLGDGTYVTRSTPAQVASSVVVMKLAAGGYHTCGPTSEGEVLCWGDNSQGQLGTGDTDDRLQPVLVSHDRR